MEKSDLLKGFNNHLVEFLEDIVSIFPENKDIELAKVSLISFKKMNPKLIISIWKTNISDVYGDKIEEGDLDYFLNKNYTNDLKDTGNANEILGKIEKLREPIKLMTDDNKNKALNYIKNLSKLCKLYYM